MTIKFAEDLVNMCIQKGCNLYGAAIEYEISRTGKSKEEIMAIMRKNLRIMKDSVNKGLNEDVKGKIIGGEAKKIKERSKMSKSVCGQTMTKAISYSLAAAEVNASMGKIVAAPTAGSCGVIPGVLFTLEEEFGLSEGELVNGLFAASAIGIVIAKNATLSGAEGGCQAEIGSAAAMGAGMAVEMLGGTPKQAFDAGAIALKNLLGLVCDPIAGLVESPCVKRNAMGVAKALICAEMALAGVESVVPFDEVVLSMQNIGKVMPCTLKETAEGGVAATPTGKKIRDKIFGST